MKKFVLICILFFMSTLVISAEDIIEECTYSDIRELNTLASYIQTNYEYNEDTKKFVITVTNLLDKFYISYDNKKYEPSNGTVIISGIDEGVRLSADVVVSVTSKCYNEKPRRIFVNIPYVNQYYNSNLCVGHESLNVCNSRFFDYKISENTFLSLIKEDVKSVEENKDDEEEKEVVNKPSIIDRTVEIVENYSIPVIIVIVVSGLTISFYSVIIRKIKHGL